MRVSDVLMSTCCVPFSVVKLFLGRWIFGECFCRFHGFDVFTFGLASLYSMEIIEISRCFCVVKDMLCYLKQERLSHTLPLCGVPLYSDRCLRFSLEMAGLNSNQEKLAKCLYTFQTNIANTAFIESAYVAIPFILIILCYVKVFYTVSSRNRIFSAKNNLHTLRANIEEASVTKTLGTVMVTFAFSWLPVCIIDYVDAA